MMLVTLEPGNVALSVVLRLLTVSPGTCAFEYPMPVPTYHPCSALCAGTADTAANAAPTQTGMVNRFMQSLLRVGVAAQALATPKQVLDPGAAGVCPALPTPYSDKLPES